MPVVTTTSGTDLPSAPPRTPRLGGAHRANLAARFLVELAMYASLADWGATIAGPVLVRVVLGVLAPLGAVTLWSRYLSPKARRRLSGPAGLAAELSLFSAASAGLALSGHVALAAGLEVVAVTNALLVRRVGHTGDTAPTRAR